MIPLRHEFYFDRFLKQLSYVTLVNIDVSRVFGEDVFLKRKPSTTCQGYCLIVHVLVGG